MARLAFSAAPGRRELDRVTAISNPTTMTISPIRIMARKAALYIRARAGDRNCFIKANRGAWQPFRKGSARWKSVSRQFTLAGWETLSPPLASINWMIRSRPSLFLRFVMTNGRSPRIRLVSISIFSSDAPT